MTDTGMYVLIGVGVVIVVALLPLICLMLGLHALLSSVSGPLGCLLMLGALPCPKKWRDQLLGRGGTEEQRRARYLKRVAELDAKAADGSAQPR